jgi:hypothetical protein
MKEKQPAVDHAPATYLLTWDPTRYAFSNFEKQVLSLVVHNCDVQRPL